jgi:S-adenosylhomocysteine hydrolase
MDIKPVKTPKFPKTDQALNNYISFLKEGFDVRIPAIDSLIEHKLREQERYKEIQQIPVILDMDIILDKINNYGISSLTEEEKDYMDNI